MTILPQFATVRRIVDDPILKPGELAALLKVSLRTLSAWRLRDRGPKWFAVGHAVRYRREDLDVWLAQRERRKIT